MLDERWHEDCSKPGSSLKACNRFPAIRGINSEQDYKKMSEENTQEMVASQKVEDVFQRLVKSALAEYGKTTWGQKHQESVVYGLIAHETGNDAGDLAEGQIAPYVRRMLNASAFAQWMEKHVKGFEREKKSEKLATKFASFEV